MGRPDIQQYLSIGGLAYTEFGRAAPYMDHVQMEQIPASLSDLKPKSCDAQINGVCP